MNTETTINSNRFKAQRLLFPVIATLLVGIATIIIWRALVFQERKQIELSVTAIATDLSRKLQLNLFDRSNEIERISGRWSTRGGTPRREWEADAMSYVEAQESYQSIQWIDPTGRIQWVVPSTGGVRSGELASDNPTAKQAMDMARSRQNQEITPPFMRDDRALFTIYDAIFTHDTFWGWAAGELDLDRWFNSVWYNVPKKSFTFYCAHAGQLLARGGAVDLPVDDSLRQTVLMTVGRAAIDVHITPTTEWVNGQRSTLPNFVLMTGMAIAFLTGWVMHLALLGRYQYQVLNAETQQRMKAEAKADTLLSHLPMEVVFKDTDLRYVSCNAAWLNAHDLRPNQVVGKTAYDFIPRDLAEKCMSTDRKVLENGETIDREESVPGMGGGERTLRMLRTRVKNELGHVLGVLEIGYDITEQRNRERLERELDQRITRAQKLEAIGEMVGWVAHDLNNLIAPVTGYPELILADLPEDSPVRPDVEEIRSAGERASHIITDLIMINPKYGSALSAVDMGQQLTGFLDSDEFRKMAGEHPQVKVRTDIDAECPAIQGTATRLDQLLNNVILNAYTAFEGAGDIEISLHSEHLEESIRGYDAIEAGDYVALRVSDTGPTIEEEHLERLFEPFYARQAMGRGSHTGMGLAAVYGIIKDMQGYIDVKSGEEGTEYTFYFPVSTEVAEPAPEELSNIGGSEHILVVDDVLQQRDLATRFLAKLGYKVTAKPSGEEAVDFLRKTKVELVLLDMHMEGGMDGLDAYKDILELHPGQQCLIATGFAMTPRIQEAMELGAGGCVRKPYTMSNIGQAVRKELNASASARVEAPA